MADIIVVAQGVSNIYAENTTGITLSKKNTSLENILKRALAASTLPTSVLVILCGFFPTLISKTNEVRVLITIMGLVVTYFAIKEIFKRD